MPALPYALGCPSCPLHVVVSEADPDASRSDLHDHILSEHAGYDFPAALELLKQARELTEEEVAAL